MKILRRVLFLGNVLLSVATICSYFSPFVNPDFSVLFLFLGLTYSGQLVLHMIFAVCWLFIRPRHMWMSVLILTLELVWFHHVVNFHLDLNQEESNKSITVATYNMQFSIDLVDASGNEEKEFINFLRLQDDIEVLCVQELGWRSQYYIDRHMHFPYRHMSESSYVAIYSKYPIINNGNLSDEFSGANDCIWADLIFYQDTIRIYNTHLESNRHDGQTPTKIDQDSPSEPPKLELFGILNHYQSYTTKREEQAHIIRDHQREVSYRSIILGDFNDVPLSKTYRTLSHNLNDTFRKRGKGIGTTLKSIAPGLRIDYILTSKAWEIVNHQISKGAFSDHHMVHAKLQLGI